MAGWKKSEGSFTTANFGTPPNYSEFEADGTLVNFGDATTFDDKQGSLILQPYKNDNSAIVLNYAENTVDIKDNAIYDQDYIIAVIQNSHKYIEGSDLDPHLHFIQKEDAIPNLVISYRWYNNGEVPPVWTNIKFDPVDFDYLQDALQILKFPLISKANSKISGNIDIHVHRDTTNVTGLFAGADTYTGDVQLKYFDAHEPQNTQGSRQRYVK